VTIIFCQPTILTLLFKQTSVISFCSLFRHTTNLHHLHPIHLVFTRALTEGVSHLHRHLWLARSPIAVTMNI